MEIKPYHPQDGIEIMGRPDFAPFASLNQVAGPGYTLFDGKTPILAGGIRIHGVGEAWIMSSDKIRQDPKLLMRTIRPQFDKIVRENQLWRLWAISKVSDTFLEHFDFVKQEGFIWQVRAKKGEQ